MAGDNKILGNFNSIDLLGFLEKKIKDGSKFENVWITDYETDIYFTPTNLYEILKENVPKIMESLQNSGKRKNVNNMQIPGRLRTGQMDMIRQQFNNNNQVGSLPFQDPENS